MINFKFILIPIIIGTQISCDDVQVSEVTTSNSYRLNSQPDSVQLQTYLSQKRKLWEKVESPFEAKFIGVIEDSTYFMLMFEDSIGRQFDFGDGENDFGKYVLFDNNNGKVGYEYIGKDFRITWKWKLSSFLCCYGALNQYSEEMPSIDSLELIETDSNHITKRYETLQMTPPLRNNLFKN